MLVMGGMTFICFLGGWLSPFGIGILPDGIWFGLKKYFFVILFVVMRAILPRYGYDQLMNLGWKCFLPLGSKDSALISPPGRRLHVPVLLCLIKYSSPSPFFCFQLVTPLIPECERSLLIELFRYP